MSRRPLDREQLEGGLWKSELLTLKTLRTMPARATSGDIARATFPGDYAETGENERTSLRMAIRLRTLFDIGLVERVSHRGKRWWTITQEGAEIYDAEIATERGRKEACPV